ncbi:BTAD domain-containing putative transcriptional regulator [Crossiella sp. CA-258035]|uniref:AfsR/SARP family transcriptional regulator n=1 Tax=Crossiella sp. CA-258035 TaxID=2981138 RepID=UPI0024BD04B7|nr:AfsR/SARP family transcriptional regulator [Crossiella sp. CA-258035]WHT16252.1 BTAD domain-containing putative transcriptional regulator [Crossiella sp. CA-258035]
MGPQQHELSFGVLGPVAAWRGAHQIDLGWPRQQAVLAVLLLELNRPVPVCALIDAVWGEAPPQGVRNTVQTNISRLRRALRADPSADRDDLVVRTDAGYLLRAEASQVDALAFEQELAAAREHRRAGNLAAATTSVESALRRWRGDPCSGLEGSYLHTRRLRLAECRLTAQELWAELLLARGEPAAVVAELTALVSAHPLRERPRELLMLALCRSGRRAEALSAYQDARTTLADRLGIDPGTGLRELYQRILAEDPEPPPAPAAIKVAPAPRPAVPVAPAQLPAAVRAFTGRDAELSQLILAASGAADPDRQDSEIIAIDGMPGVGKTALAVHAARAVAEHFPDGQIYLRLGAFSADRPPVAPEDALADLLRAVGVPGAEIPDGLPARAARWQASLRGKRMLLVLDDATGHEQLRPLLPGPGRCLVLITSRRRLTALEGLRTLELHPLPAEEARALFLRLAGRPEQEPDPVALAELTALCGRLPLAITLLAGRLRHRPRWTLRYLVDLLASSRMTLGELHAENVTLTAAFELSYRNLTEGQQRLFRSLALLPGNEIEVHATAALAGLEVPETRHELEQLYDDHLLTESEPGRYLLHDLVKEYALTLAEQDDPAPRAAAAGRLLEYYLDTTALISTRVLADAPMAVPVLACRFAHDPAVDTDAGALAWLDREGDNLVACLTCPSASAHAALAVSLTTALHPYLRSRGHWHRSISLHQAALALAEDIGDEPARAAVLHNLGTLRRLTGDHPGARRDLGDALARYRALGHLRGEAGVLTELGVLDTATGAPDTATTHLRDAQRRYRLLGNPLGQAHVQLHLGILRHQLGDLPGAAAHLCNARHRYRLLANPLGQAHVLAAIGHLGTEAGEFPVALAALTEALAGYRALGDQLGQATTLSHLGDCHRQAGDPVAAQRHLDQALTSFAGADEPLGHATARHRLATLHLATGGHTEALREFRQALGLGRRLGARAAIAAALTGMGRCLVHLGDPERGADHLRQAVALLTELGSPEAAEVNRALSALPAAS